MKVYGNFKQKESLGDFGGLGLYEGQISGLYSEIATLKSRLSQTKPYLACTWRHGNIRCTGPTNTYSDYPNPEYKNLRIKIKNTQVLLNSYSAKEKAWQEEERLLLQKSTAAAVEEAEHVEELQMTIDHLNSQLRANKNMNITLVDQNAQMVKQVNTYKERVSQIETQNSTLTKERNALISERDSLKAVVESQLGPQEPKTSNIKKVMVVGVAATAGLVGYKMLAD